MPSNSKIDTGLNETQRKAVEHSGGPLLIAAGAGSGKTKTLTSRLIHLLKSGVKPEQIIAITFTNKAAKEMKDRVNLLTGKLVNQDKKNSDQLTNQLMHQSTPFIGTFHSLGARILREQGLLVGRNKMFTIFDEDDALSLVKSILSDLRLSKDRFNPLAVMATISKIKNELSDEVLDEGGHYEKVVATVYKNYEEKLQGSNAFDFDDLIEKVVKIFQSHPDILAQYQNQWQHILVDEFQDVNTSQYLLIKLLAQKHQNLFVIGDDAQSIYAFRGSDFRNFLNFEKDWPRADIIKLEENYRSTQNIIRAASEVIKQNKMQKPKELWTKNAEGELIQLRAFQTNDDEAWGVAEKITEILQKGEPLNEIAILYRTNAQSRAIEQALIQTRIPYEIFGGLKFYARKEIKDIVAALRYAFNPKDIASIERINKNFTKAKATHILEDMPRLAGELSIVELIKFFIENTDYIEYLEKHYKNPDERHENIKELINFASTFKDAHDFLERVALLSSSDGRPKLQQNAVKLMTIHLAKGLEFNHVFVVGANDGLLPHERSLFQSDQLEEERRLMYVAMTRARHALHVSFYDLPSRFLGEIPPELLEFKKVTNYGEQNRDWDDETIYIE